MKATEIINTIVKISNESKTCVHFGIRRETRKLEIGYELPNSKAMSDDDYDVETDSYPELPGTCALGFGMLWFDGEEDDIEEVNRVIEQAKEQYDDPYCYTYLIMGSNYEYGTDKGEVILEDAIVVAEV